MMEEAGLSEARTRELSLGAARVFSGRKRGDVPPGPPPAGYG